MTASLGYLALVVAAGSSGWLIVRALGVVRGRSPGGRNRFQMPVLGILLGAVVAMSALEIAILTDDFSVEYVANYSASTTPLLFKIASAWGALEGSILLWGLILAGYLYTVYRRVAKRGAGDRLGGGALLVLGIVALFFFGMMLTVSNPFRACVEASTVGCASGSAMPWVSGSAAIEGRGPNPLLQNHILMAIHPPMLYLGYVGMAVPFSFAMSALMLGVTGSEWLRRTRAWTLVAWAFLTVGIVLGGWWSYEVLGWGGYWAWDPVENASFMPWLTATAFLHSAVVQERRGMLQAWNFVLVIATFALTILGTFLTRSGVILSVHSFSQSAIGPVLLWFLLVVLVVSFGLLAMRSSVVSSAPRLDSLVSREGAFLLNNLLLSVFAIVVLIGTLYPMFVEAFSGDRVGVGRPFFDRMAIPICFTLLLAMGIGPVTPYRAARPSVIWERIRLPFRLALGVGALAVILSYRSPFLLLGILTSSFVIFVIVVNLYRTARTMAQKREFGLATAALRVMRNDAPYWGGQLSHLGVAIVALGIAASSSLSVETTLELTQGETATVAGYELTYLHQFTRQESQRSSIGASVDVGYQGDSVSVLEPRLNQYGSSATIATPAVHTSFKGDIYLTIKGIGPDRVTLGVWWFPLIWMVYVGGLLAGLGGFWSRLAGRRSRGRSPARSQAVDHV
ncbi:MAG: heme lyase CcmF/NrfE family subunit [Acidimicrobiia bacterium]